MYPRDIRWTALHSHLTRMVPLVLAMHFCANEAYPQPTIDYTNQIKPILRSRCYACHGALEQEAGLRLDTGTSIRRGGDSGVAVIADAPGDSLLIERVSAEDASERMPPEGDALTREQVSLLQTWISQGAQSPANELPESDPREHWSFQNLQRPAVPDRKLGVPHRYGNPIDAFVNDKLMEKGLLAQPQAPRHVQLRRVYLDLIGLPPDRDELRRFLGDSSVDAYQKVVDRLLNDPRYGERWGRHWMDVWRYSDWYGRRNVPDVWNSAPQVWRWRDWIVRSLNEDESYAQMIREMLAADEISPEDPHTAIATGYLVRNWYALNPNDWMRNTVEHTGKAFLGLTFNCAHCHDHKYDPIAQEDYFRLRAFFEPMYVRQDRLPGEADPGQFQDYEYSTLRKIQQLGTVRAFDKTPNAVTWFYTDGDERNRVQERGSIAPGVPTFLPQTSLRIEQVDLPTVAWYPAFDPAIRETVRADALRAVRSADRELEAASNARDTSSSDIIDDRIETLLLQRARAEQAAAHAELVSIEARIVADEAVYGATADADAEMLAQRASQLECMAHRRRLEVDVLTKEHSLVSAEIKLEDDASRSKEVEAAEKAYSEAKERLAESEAGEPDHQTYTPLSPVYPRTSTGRRRALAEWITSRENPLTARVAVNHMWMRHFHVPLVATVDDFGRNGAEPTHPQLLDWLAVELIESGWSMKHLHRLIVTSETYRRSSSQAMSVARNEPAQLDPENTTLWRMNVGRMEAEVVRDSLFFCGGLLDLTVGGQPLENEETLTTYRRTLYYEVYPEDGGAGPLSTLFDPPNPLECYRRTRSIVPQQALALTNSEIVHQVSQRIVRLWQEHADISDNRQFIADVFEKILSRPPSVAELRFCDESLARQVAILTAEGVADPQMAARQSVVRAILNHNDFVAIR